MWSCAMTVTEAITQSVSATGESVELPAFLHLFPLEPRCRVCRNDRLRTKVNDMLTTGVSYAMILRALQKDNDQLDTPTASPSIRSATTPPATSRCRTSRRPPTAHPGAAGAGERRRLRQGRGQRNSQDLWIGVSRDLL